MSILERFFALVLLSDEVTNITSNRVYPGNLPEKPPFPCLEIVHVSTDFSPFETSNGPTGNAYSEIQFDAMSRDKREPTTLINAVRSHFQSLQLDGWRNESLIQDIQFDGELTEAIPPADGSGNWLYRHALKITVMHFTVG